MTLFFFWFSLLLDLQVDSARRHGILLEAVQVLTDLNLSIKKAYISSDASWFMDGEKKPPKVLFLVLGIFVEASPKQVLTFSHRIFSQFSMSLIRMETN
jgi:hypothetical protein